MVGMFIASSQTHADVPQFGSFDWPVKKIAHVNAYGFLGVAYLHGLSAGRRPTFRLAVMAVLMAGAYGATDEFHQSFVPGRGAGPVDVVIDTIGAMAGIAAFEAMWRATRTPAQPAPPRSTR
jgi:VanZ family protein